VEPAPLGVKHARRSAKKAETEGRVPLATKAGHTAIGVGAKAKAIKEIDSKESDNEGGQAQTGADHAGKTAKKAKDQEAGINAHEGGAQDRQGNVRDDASATTATMAMAPGQCPQ
jgi:hypothetical protein